MTSALRLLAATLLAVMLCASAGCAAWPPPDPDDSPSGGEGYGPGIGTDPYPEVSQSDLRFGNDRMGAETHVFASREVDAFAYFQEELAIRLYLLGEEFEAAELRRGLSVDSPQDPSAPSPWAWLRLLGEDFGSLDEGTPATGLRSVRPLETIRLGPDSISLGFEVTVMAEARRGVSSFDLDSAAQVTIRAAIVSTSGTLLENRMIGPNIALRSRNAFGTTITSNAVFERQVHGRLVVGTGSAEATRDGTEDVLADYGSPDLVAEDLLDVAYYSTPQGWVR